MVRAAYECPSGKGVALKACFFEDQFSRNALRREVAAYKHIAQQRLNSHNGYEPGDTADRFLSLLNWDVEEGQLVHSG